MSERSEQQHCRTADFKFGVSPTNQPLRRAADYWRHQSEQRKPIGMDWTEQALLVFVIFVLGAVALAALRIAFS